MALLRTVGAYALCVASCIWLGELLLFRLRRRLERWESIALAFLVGAAFLSLLVFIAGVLGVVNVYFYFAVAGTLGGVAAIRRAPRAETSPPPARPSKVWIAFSLLVATSFGGFYLVTALAPEVSPDGASYHLSLVAQYVRDGVIQSTPTNFYSAFSQGLEMLFLFVAIWGTTSSAALIHLTFLAVVALLLVMLGRRSGQAASGIAAAIIFSVVPVVGIDASSAYNDVALAATAVGCFYLLTIWEQDQRLDTSFFAGCLAGFCFGIKYSGGGGDPSRTAHPVHCLQR